MTQGVPPTLPADQRPAALSELLENLEEVKQSDLSSRNKAQRLHQNQLVQVRLGIASGLFTALRAKHPPTAAHSLRVALICSSWSDRLELDDEQRDILEISALLHDIGKIGVPDAILEKPGKLSSEEAVILNRQRQHGLDILEVCCVRQEILTAIRYAPAWYDGQRTEFDRHGEELPLASRIVAIADAYDAMTTDRIYRRAVSRERALAELFQYAGTQFDRKLVGAFSQYLGGCQDLLAVHGNQGWLRQLEESQSNTFWQLREQPSEPPQFSTGELFHHHLLDTINDGVIFVDSGLKILEWNRAAAYLTGISASSIEHQQWRPGLVEMRDEDYRLLSHDQCPLLRTLWEGTPQMRQLFVTNGRREKVSVTVQASPVVGENGVVHGATMILRDGSSEMSLKERMASLHTKATHDPLTTVANRAEFDRIHQDFVKIHLEKSLPCCLVICDLDFFKRINDTYGHQAGDEALVAFANLLKRYCRSGDLVARYGGEEFVILYADCDIGVATDRAETIRVVLANQSHASLGGKRITASFGVTEVQAGDSAETMLRRADRALLQAKDNGRNTVVQLGTGLAGEMESPRAKTGWLAWLQASPADDLVNRKLVTTVPLNIAAEKLRGFITDHYAEIIDIEENHITLRIDEKSAPMLTRAMQGSTAFFIELHLQEMQIDDDSDMAGDIRTVVHVTIRPKRQRDRRKSDAVERSQLLLASIKSYLMAHDYVAAR